MSETVYLLNMFPDYEPPEEIRKALSQAALVAVDIRAENRSVEVAAHIISPLSMYKKRSYKIVTPLNDFYASFASLRASCDFFLAALFL